VFDWRHAEKTLYDDFAAIQEAAGVRLECRNGRTEEEPEDKGDHVCTDACHCYTFHDLRRAFATANAERLTGDALQKLMRHKSYATTQRYINVATQLNRALDNLFVPTLPAVEALVRHEFA